MAVTQRVLGRIRLEALRTDPGKETCGPMTRHPLGRLDGYLEGTLTGRRRRRVSGHLASCAYCSAVAQERSRVLAAARRVERHRVHGAAPAGHGSSAAPPPAADTRAEGAGSVMAHRGVPGRLVVAGLGVLVVAAGAVTAVWVAGDPDDAAAAAAELSDARSIVAGAEADAAAGSGSAAEATSAVAAENGSAIRALRRHGWAVPSLQPVGLRPLDLDVAGEGGVMEVSVDWSDEDRRVHVRECRTTGSAEVPDACPGQDGAPTATEGTLPVGVTYHVTADDGRDTWTATLPIGAARYVVTSDLPRDRVEQLLSTMVVSDRSGVADDLRAPEEISDRLERGIDRLLGAADIPFGVAATPVL